MFSNFFKKEEKKEIKTKSKYNLELLQIITRHGKRTPIYILPFLNSCEKELEEIMQEKYEKQNWDNGFNVFVKTPYSENLYQKEYTYNKNLHGKSDQGQLTTEGAEQIFNLGKEIRSKYEYFLPKIYNDTVL
jgi:hypothetical protein